MDSKILYTNDVAEIQCVAVKPIEMVRNASGTSRSGIATHLAAKARPQRTPLCSSDEAVFLLPHESLYSYLYIGAADGTLLALRFQIFLKELAVPGGGLIYEHQVSLEAQSKTLITAAAPAAASGAANEQGTRAQTGGEQDGASTSSPSTTTTATAVAPTDGAAKESSSNPTLCGVRAIHAPIHLPYLFLLVHGHFEVHEDDTLQLLEPAYTGPLDLTDSKVLLMCTGEEQSVTSRQRRSPMVSIDGDDASTAEVKLSVPAVYYALLLDSWMVILVECTKISAARLSFLRGAAEEIGCRNEDIAGAPHSSLALSSQNGAPQSVSRSMHVADTLLPVRPGTSTMAWCGDVLITGSQEYYCLYDTLHGSVLSQLNVSSLCGGCPPYTTYIRSAAVDPKRAGFELAAESAEIYSGDSSGCSTYSSSQSSSSDGDSSSASSSSTASHISGDSREANSLHSGEVPRGAATTTAGWPSALVFRLRDGQLRACAGAGRNDLTAAAPITDAFGGMQEVYSCPPFLLCQRGGCSSCDEGGKSAEGSALRSQSSSRICASIAELHRASQPLSTKLYESRCPAKQCEVLLFSCLDGQPWTSPEVEPVSFVSANLCGVRAFPLGLLGVSRHMVEALLWKPFAMQLEDQIETGHYARVLRFVSQCFRGSESARRVVVRRVCQASAMHAISRRRYRVAFYFSTLAETGVDSLLRLFPELQRLSVTSAGKQPHSTNEGDHENSTSCFAKNDVHTVSVGLGATGIGAKNGDRSAPFAERHTRGFSYASQAPYRALYRILISKFFSLVAEAAAVNTTGEEERVPSEDDAQMDCSSIGGAGGVPTHSHNADDVVVRLASGPATPTATSTIKITTTTPSGTVFPLPSQPATPAAVSHGTALSPSWSASPLFGGPSPHDAAPFACTRANIEFALFCLFAIDCAGARRLHARRDELLQFMAFVETLNSDECAGVVTALGLPAQPLLMTMLLAATGDYDAALTRCQACSDVAGAGAIFAMYARTRDSTSAQLEKLYQLHLPWMLVADPPTTVQLLTTPVQFDGERPGPAVLLPVLLAVGGTVLLDYLSYLINVECNAEAAVHQLYATQLVRNLQTLRKAWGLQGFASAELGAADGAGTEMGLVGHLRRALLSFLQCSHFYDKERVLATLVEADLYEEQCIVLEALEDHIGVLTVLVYAIKDMNRAVRYCEAHYMQDRAHVHQWLFLTDSLRKSATVPTTFPSLSARASHLSQTAASGGAPPRQIEEALDDRGLNVAWSSSATGAMDDALPTPAPPDIFLDEAAPPYPSPASGKEIVANTADGVLNVPLFPSRDCHRVASSETIAMSHDTREAATATALAAAPATTNAHRPPDSENAKGRDDDDAPIDVAPPCFADWNPIMRFNQYLHMLLHVLLVPPTGKAIALPEIVWLLNTHSLYMNPRLVLSSLPGDVLLLHIAPYLIRAFQRLELNHQLVRIESAAVESILADAVRRHVTLQQRCVWMDNRRRCVVCGELLEKGGLVVVFPNLKPVHFRCHQDDMLDPERGVPFFSNVM